MVDDDAESSVRTVLRQEAYPWYDGQTDQVTPLVTEQPTWAQRAGRPAEIVLRVAGKALGKASSGAPSRPGRRGSDALVHGLRRCPARFALAALATL